MTVWDNAAYGLKMRRAPPAAIKDVVGHYLARTGLTRFAKYYPHQLSGGMRQRVSIARAFANDPEILLMECAPAGGGDEIMSVQTIWTRSRAPPKMSARRRDCLLNVISPLALLVLWELCARFGFIDTRFFPAPSSVVSTMIEMLRTGELVTHTAVSMQ